MWNSKLIRHPDQIQGLHHFSAQIFNQDGSPVSGLKNLKVWKARRSRGTISLDKLDKMEFEEGWHFVRVLPRTEDGEQIPLSLSAQTEEDDLPKPNESAPFYVLLDGTVD